MTVVHRAYMDESYDGERIPVAFTLSCLVANNSAWPFFEWDWCNVLEKKNEQLRSQGRREISRFHAADCSSFRGDFEGWTETERRELIGQLLATFGKHGIHIYGHNLPLRLLVSEIPETAPNPVGFAYVILLNLLMLEICANTMRLYPDAVISLHHDRCPYDAALQEAFNHLIADDQFKCAKQFTSITSEGWEYCVPLQPADFVAYENFKEIIRQQEALPRNRRKSFELLFDLDSVSGRLKGFDANSIRVLKDVMDNMDHETKDILLRNARIKN